MAMTGVAFLVEHHPTKRKVTSGISHQGTCLGSRFGPQSGRVQEATSQCFSLTLLFLSLSFSLPSLFSKNKEVKSFEK